MRFIRLTCGRSDVWINMDHIEAIYREGTGSKLFTTGEQQNFYVTSESPEDILARIEEHHRG